MVKKKKERELKLALKKKLDKMKLRAEGNKINIFDVIFW